MSAHVSLCRQQVLPENKEQSGRRYNGKASEDVNGAVPRVLQPASQAEDSVPSEMLVVPRLGRFVLRDDFFM